MNPQVCIGPAWIKSGLISVRIFSNSNILSRQSLQPVAFDAYDSNIEDENAIEIRPEQRELLSLYHNSFNDEKVDQDLIVELVRFIQRKYAFEEEGAILIFLPGYDDIVTLRDRLQGDPGAPTCTPGCRRS